MSTGATPRQLDILAAWWRGGGSNTRAAELLGLSVQTVRNTLFTFRRKERVETTLLLALRYRTAIEGRAIERAA